MNPMTTYEITDPDGTTVYLEGDAETVLDALIDAGAFNGTDVRVYRI